MLQDALLYLRNVHLVSLSYIGLRCLFASLAPTKVPWQAYVLLQRINLPTEGMRNIPYSKL